MCALDARMSEVLRSRKGTPAPTLTPWPPLRLSAYVKRPADPPPFPLGDPGCSLFERGRHALWQGVRALGLNPGDEVLVPAYHCGAEVDALLDAGLTCRFYDVRETLEPDPAVLEPAIGPRTRALLLIHYLGFPQDAPRWRAWCDERDMLLIEDCAQAWLSSLRDRPLGSFGDLAIFSFAKTVALPDGGGAVAPAGRLPAGRHGRPGLVAAAKLQTLALLRAAGALEPWLVRREHRSTGQTTLGDPERGPSLMTRLLVGRVPAGTVVERRRANYLRLLDEFAAAVPPPFAQLPDGVCPLAFPVELREGPERADSLERAGITALPLWPSAHPTLPTEGFPGANAWRRRFLPMPIHQELRAADLERVAAVLRSLVSAEASAPPAIH